MLGCIDYCLDKCYSNSYGVARRGERDFSAQVQAGEETGWAAITAAKMTRDEMTLIEEFLQVGCVPYDMCDHFFIFIIVDL